MQVTHNNHFVPQSYLRRWSDNERRIWCYRVLVPNKNVPEWQQKPVKGVAYQPDLYTNSIGELELDEFERWLEEEIETPAQNAIDKALIGDILTTSELEHLLRYVAAQDVRTPRHYLSSMQRWNDKLPELMQKTLDEAMYEFKVAKRTGKKLITEDTPEKNPFADVIKVKINRNGRPETNQPEISVSVLPGRRMWIDEQRHVLNGIVKVLYKHSWVIVKAANNFEWLTSDNPVTRLNDYGDGRYDFKGGWNNKGSTIFMPLSPKYLLITEVGKDLKNRSTLSELLTIKIQKYTIENAYRMIFARKPMSYTNKLHPRIVDPKMYLEEQEAWRNWHSDQSKAEQDLDDGN